MKISRQIRQKNIKFVEKLAMIKRAGFIAFWILCNTVQGQKTIKDQGQFWFMTNNQFSVHKTLAIETEGHVRWNLDNKKPYLFRGSTGIVYFFHKDFHINVSYLVQNRPYWSNNLGENLLDHGVWAQIGWSTRWDKLAINHRFRVETIWRDQEDPTFQTINRLSRIDVRPRYQIAIILPCWNNPYIPQPMVSDELIMLFSKKVNNIFNENRLFLGVRGQMVQGLSYDFGYMMIFQQASATSYNRNHALRLFLYYRFHKKTS